MEKMVLIIVTMALSGLANAELRNGAPLSLRYDLDGWITSAKVTAKSGVTECRKAKEIESVLVCIHPDIDDMHDAIGRASVFVEGIGPEASDQPGVLVPIHKFHSDRKWL